MAELKNWLEQKGRPLPRELPPGFARLRMLGCRTLVYDGRQISLVCFEHNGKEFHVFIARRADFPNTAFASIPALGERRTHATATWSDTENHYVLVSEADLASVRALLGAG